MVLARPLAALGALAFLWAGVVSDACAQQVYKIVGPDGRITFSDKPPLNPEVKAEPAKTVSMRAGGSGLASLPFELRQAAQRYPVTLYTAAGCEPCTRGRSFLSSRGIPFSEKTVSTREDADALLRLANTKGVPVLMIGGQQLKGFSDTEWGQFLDAAGYPKTSQLPPTYVAPAAQPLVALDQQEPKAPAEADAAREQPPARPTRPTAPAGDNPAGIQF